jgi:hypothetical protein
MAKFCRVHLERAHVHVSRKKFFALVIVVLLALNLFTFSLAYPTLTRADLYGDNKPRDFSVYYVTVWRMFHDPSQIFTAGYLHDGEPVTRPFLTPYKYLPSFLILISPLDSLPYYPALWVFDLFQLALLPLIGIMLYYLLEKKHPAVAFAVLVTVLLMPQPLPGRGLSVSYFSQWTEGQAKILLTFLLLFSFYLGYNGRPKLSGIIFAIGCFDPRFGLLALPLFLFYNKSKLKASVGFAAIALVSSNLLLLYPGVAKGFVTMIVNTGASTPFFESTLIPAFMIACLLVVNISDMIKEFKRFFHLDKPQMNPAYFNEKKV